MNRPELALWNWDAIDEWAMMNNPLWATITQICQDAEATEEQRLRALCIALLGVSEEAREQLRQKELRTVSIFTPYGEWKP